MITSCNSVSGGSGVCILCLFMPFAKVSRAGRSDSKAAFGFRDKICSNFSFGFQVVRVLTRSDSGSNTVIGRGIQSITQQVFLTMFNRG